MVYGWCFFRFWVSKLQIKLYSLAGVSQIFFCILRAYQITKVEIYSNRFFRIRTFVFWKRTSCFLKFLPFYTFFSISVFVARIQLSIFLCPWNGYSYGRFFLYHTCIVHLHISLKKHGWRFHNSDANLHVQLLRKSQPTGTVYCQ